MRALLDIVGADMVAGIQTEKLTGDKKVGDKVWNMMTEFRINVESEKASIKRDIRLIEKQIAQMDDSREMLFGIKRNIEASKRQQKLMSEVQGDKKEQKQSEVREEIRRLRNDFKHYIRHMWLYQEAKHNSFVLDLGQAAGLNKQVLDDLFVEPLGKYTNRYNMLNNDIKGIDYAYRKQSTRPASVILKGYHQGWKKVDRSPEIIGDGPIGITSPISTMGGQQWGQMVQMMRPLTSY